MCVPSGMTACGDGTRLENGQCVVDPATCQAGTVLVANRCVDPNQGLVIDLEESAEPNGLGTASGVEASPAPAGQITLPPAGTAFIIHGHLTPFRDTDGDGQLDPDFDSFTIGVSSPTLLAVSVDGVGGVQGAFYVTGTPSTPVAAYERYGLNLTGDTSKRHLLLPASGVYRLTITDTRSLSIGSNPPGPAGEGGAAGGPDAAYYATITVEPLPAPAPVVLTAGSGMAAGTLATDAIALFTAALPAGTQVTELMPGAATASVMVISAGALVGYADENPGDGTRPPTTARVTVSGVDPGDAPVIAVDAVYNYGPAAEPFQLKITAP